MDNLLYTDEPSDAEVRDIYFANCGENADIPLAYMHYENGVFYLENQNGSLGYVASRQDENNSRYWTYFESLGEAVS